MNRLLVKEYSISLLPILLFGNFLTLNFISTNTPFTDSTFLTTVKLVFNKNNRENYRSLIFYSFTNRKIAMQIY